MTETEQAVVAEVAQIVAAMRRELTQHIDHPLKSRVIYHLLGMIERGEYKPEETAGEC